jgi:hypothetical protein
MREVLSSGKVAAAIDSVAASVASRIGAIAHDGPIEVRVGSYKTDRAAAGVTLAHPAGLAVEAKYGHLAEAAGAAGLEVRTR